MSAKRLFLAVILAAVPLLAPAAEGSLDGGVNPGYHPPPGWFKESFLDIAEDVAEAAGQEKGLLLYFYQDGCPYCAKLLEDNFGQSSIVEKTRGLYDVVAINIWGDREVIHTDGRAMKEKEFAAELNVMFTPTMLFLDGQGQTVLRLNGYYPPHKFSVALDYGAGRGKEGVSFAEFLDAVAPVAATGFLHDEPFFLAPPHNLSRQGVRAQRPLLVLFEQKECVACDEFHADVLQRDSARELMAQFDVVQLDRLGKTPVVTPGGQRLGAAEWARELKVQYAPTMVFFDEQGDEVFRAEAYLKSFHVQSVLEYIASGAYREQPNFQRFVQARADRLREEGGEVDLWQ